MKKSLILATALTAALLTVSLTACDSSKGDFKLADYAQALSESAVTVSGSDAYSKSTKIADATAAKIGTYEKTSVVSVRGTTGYKLYSLQTGNYLLDGKEYEEIGTMSSAGSSSNNPFIRLRKSIEVEEENSVVSGYRVYDVCGPDGALLIEETISPSFSIEPTYANNTVSYVYTVSYQNVKYEDFTKYFVFTDAGNNGYGTSLKEISEEELNADEDEIKIGDSFSNLSASELDKYGSALEGYSVTTESLESGTRYTFKKGGEVTGTLALGSNDYKIDYHGDSLYYYHFDCVAETATKGFNVVLQMQYRDMKYNITYFRYNIVKGKTQTVKTDYFFGDLEAVYNYSAKACDKLYAEQAYKFENGVAIIGEGSKSYSLLLGENLAVSADFTDKVYSPTDVVKLAEDRYLAKGASYTYLLDGEENVLATYAGSLSSLRIDTAASLIAFSYNGAYMATDFNGKVVLENKYASSFNFYGNYTYTTTTEGENLIISAANPAGKTPEEIVGEQYSNVQYMYGVIVAHNSTDSVYSVFDLAGKELLTIENVNAYNDVTVLQVGNRLLVNASVYESLTSYGYVSYYIA